MRFSAPLAALALLLPLASAEIPSGGPPGAWPSEGGNGWATETDSVTTTYIAETTITMTLLAVQTETMHYFSAKNATSAASSTYKVASSSVQATAIDVTATPSTCENCAPATGAANVQNVNVAVAAVAGIGALFWSSL